MSKKELLIGVINHSKKFGNWKRFQEKLRKFLHDECNGGFNLETEGFSVTFTGYHDEGESLFGAPSLAMKQREVEKINPPVSAEEHAKVVARKNELEAKFVAFLAANQEQKAAMAGEVVFSASFDDFMKPQG